MSHQIEIGSTTRNTALPQSDMPGERYDNSKADSNCGSLTIAVVYPTTCIHRSSVARTSEPSTFYRPEVIHCNQPGLKGHLRSRTGVIMHGNASAPTHAHT